MWWEDSSCGIEESRFAEFLQLCEWQFIKSASAQIELKQTELTEEENFETRLVSKSLKIAHSKYNPVRSKKTLTFALRQLLGYINNIGYESSSFGLEAFTKTVYRKCGAAVFLEIDVAERAFVFTGNRKRVIATVQEMFLEIKRFHVAFDTPTDSSVEN